MKLRNLDFGSYVFDQAGVEGFFGEGDEYPHHQYYKHIPGFSFEGMSFVAKTVTWGPRLVELGNSNTRLVDGYKLADFFPNSIWVSVWSFIKGYMLNAVGLANPGMHQMMKYQKWQKRADTYQLSLMLMSQTTQQRELEARALCHEIREAWKPNRYPFAIQLNESCPNTGHEQLQKEDVIIESLKIFREELPGIVLIPKFDLLVSPETIIKLKPYCDAFCVANTIPFGKKKNASWWAKLFRKGVSPLLKFFDGKFAGGLSGAPLFPILVEWLEEMERRDPTVNIIAGGGIMKKKHIRRLEKFKCVRAVALGSVATLRPWRMKGLIKYGNEIFSIR